jgi:hypothetical protein
MGLTRDSKRACIPASLSVRVPRKKAGAARAAKICAGRFFLLLSSSGRVGAVPGPGRGASLRLRSLGVPRKKAAGLIFKQEGGQHMLRLTCNVTSTQGLLF